jgi:3',5'-nucleoside bisphosphate phosphatase
VERDHSLATDDMLVDLHTHTIASDGLVTPEVLVHEAFQRGIAILSVTDHDSTDSVAAATATGEHVGVRVVPGVELSATSSAGDLHLLGYFIDPEGDELQSHLIDYREARNVRARKMIARLQESGVPISLDQVMMKAGGGSVSRAHLGRVLVDLGFADSISDAFARWLGRNRPGFVPREPLIAADAIGLVLRNGGVPVLAHPLTMGDYQRQLPELKAAGLLGIEVYYGPYDPAQRAELLEVARAERLIATGGSDYHGPGHREGRDLGSGMPPASCVDDLARVSRNAG